MKKLLPALTALASLALVTGAQAAHVPQGTNLAPSQVLHFHTTDNPKTFDPNNLEEQVGLRFANQTFEGLVTFDENGKITPGVAAEWSHSDDYTTWTFKLRPEAKWSDGNPVTAEDFVTSWRRLVDPKNAFPYAFYLEDLGVKNAGAIVANDPKVKLEDLGVKALDEHTLEVKLEQAVPWFLEAVVLRVLAPVPTKLLAAGTWPNVNHLVSNGAYTLAEAKVNESYKFTANPYYWDHKNTVITEVDYQVVPSEASAYARLASGALDALELISPNYQTQAEQDGRWSVLTAPSNSTTYYMFNLNKAPFDNVKVRKAFAYVFDFKNLQERVLRNSVIASSLFTPKYAGFEGLKEAEWYDKPYAQRVKEANQLLEEAGYNEKNPLVVNLGYNTSDTNRRVAVAYQGMVHQAFGSKVKLTTTNQEFQSFIADRRQGVFALARAGWGADFNHPASFYTTFVSNSPVNDSKYNNPEYDQTFKKLYKTKSVEEQVPIFQKLNDLLQTDFPGIIGYHQRQFHAVNPNLKGYNVDENVRQFQHMYLVAPKQ